MSRTPGPARSAGPTSASDAMTATDPAELIRAQVVLEEHDLAADGSFAVVSRRVVARNGYISHLWLLPLGGGSVGARAATSIRLTQGHVRDTRPRVSPDGRRVAFRRRSPDDPDAPTRLLVLELDGTASRRARARPPGGTRTGRRTVSRPWPIAAGGRDVGQAEWSPDGSRLAFTAEVDPPRFLVGPKPRGHDAPLARVVRRLDFRWDESGFLDRWSHLFIVDARRGAAATQLTAGDFGVDGIAWSPDGRTIAFVADLKPDADLRPGTSIWAVPVDGGTDEPRLVLSLAAMANRPAYSPDGRWLAAVGVDDPDPHDEISPTLFVGPADGSGSARAVAPDLDRPIGAWIDSDLTGWTADSRPGPAWLDARTIVAIVSDRGRAAPWAFTIDPESGMAAGPPRPMATAEAGCTSLAVGGGVVSALGVLDGRAPELLVFRDDELRSRTRMGSAWQRRFAWPEMRLLAAPGPDGTVESWLASPPDAGDAPLPTVVDVHGGPLGAWNRTPAVEVALLTSRGYRVVLPNIHGSAGYGAAWIAPQLGDWGGIDAADVHAALDHVVELGLADATRVGVLGLSYGGFMVQWLVGTTGRFRAAVSENGVANQVSAWANSDSGVEYNRWARLGDPLSTDGAAALWRQSPLRNAANVRTPLLMLQAGADLRCPPADNEQLFTALRVLGREVEFVIYPEESHVYQASGRPDRRVDRMTRMLDWFDRHLLG